VDATPASPPVFAAPASQWNTGANSVAALDGDVSAVFEIDAVPAGIAIGLKGSRAFTSNPSAINYAARFYAVGTGTSMEIWEGAAQRMIARTYTLGTSVEIRRVASIVQILVGGALIYESKTPSFGALIVNACLYSAGDTVP
jgi:hypothetical protein